MSRSVFVVLVGGVVLVSCASELKQRPPSLDPSSPDAPESAPLPVSAALAPELEEKPSEVSVPPPEDPGDGRQHEQAPGFTPDAGATVLTCPMHPEVKQSGPGRCPKCGMDLVPEEPEKESKPQRPKLKPQEHQEHDSGGHR